MVKALIWVASVVIAYSITIQYSAGWNPEVGQHKNCKPITALSLWNRHI